MPRTKANRSTIVRSLVAAAVLALVLPAPGAAAQIESEIAALVGFSTAWTNDDGTVDDPAVDPGDVGDVSTGYDAWGTTSSNDPTAPGVGAVRLDTDVSRCAASLATTDLVEVVVQNAYPGYACTFATTIANQSNFPATVGVVAVTGDAGLTVTEIDGVEGDMIGPAAEARAVLAVQVDDDAPQGATLLFEVVITVGGDVIDVELGARVSNPAVAVGSRVTFTVTATNRGPDDATDVRVVGTPDTGLGFVSADPGAGTSFSGSTWSIPALAAGAAATLDLVFTVDAAGILGLVCEVTAHVEPDVDSKPDNHVMTEDDMDRTEVRATAVQAATVEQTETLPATGSDVIGIVGTGLALTFLGLAALVTSRRRARGRLPNR